MGGENELSNVCTMVLGMSDMLCQLLLFSKVIYLLVLGIDIYLSIGTGN